MKPRLTSFITINIFAVFFSCSKEGTQQIVTTRAADYALVTDTVRIPLIDMGLQTYLGFTGGLYPGGSNVPPGVYGKDLVNFATNIIPRDSNGRSSAKGKIGFISLGASTCGNMMKALIQKTVGNPLTNPSLFLVNCCNGNQTASINNIMNPADPYWTHVDIRLQSTHLAYKQVQVIYLETDDSISTMDFPGRPYRTRDEYEIALRLFKTKFPKLKLVYVLGRTTTFHVKMIPNVEPCPYYNGWACKFVIEDQINGKTGTKYKGINAVAPMITWGWYEWANGTNVPRSDGFTWEASDTQDGIHGTLAGEDTLSAYFQKFLLTDSAAKIWYAKK